MNTCTCWCSWTPMINRPRSEQNMFTHLLTLKESDRGPERHLVCGMSFYRNAESLSGAVKYYINLSVTTPITVTRLLCLECIEKVPSTGEYFDAGKVKVISEK